MLLQQVCQGLKLLLGLPQPLDGLYVREVGLAQLLVLLSDCGQRGPDIPVGVAPAHKSSGESSKGILGRISDLSGSVRHAEFGAATNLVLDKREITGYWIFLPVHVVCGIVQDEVLADPLEEAAGRERDSEPGLASGPVTVVNGTVNNETLMRVFCQDRPLLNIVSQHETISSIECF